MKIYVADPRMLFPNEGAFVQYMTASKCGFFMSIDVERDTLSEDTFVIEYIQDVDPVLLEMLALG
jgi:hypothetical protein